MSSLSHPISNTHTKRIAAPELPLGLVDQQISRFPPTRFMGSKEKILPTILSIADQFTFDTVIDLFSGSGVVAYGFKSCGKQVLANDYMAMAATTALALVENNSVRLDESDIEQLLAMNPAPDCFVSCTFRGLYFDDADNLFIDNLRTNIRTLTCKYKRALATTCLVRTCLKKRPRGVFTYTGLRYDDGRLDIRMSMKEHFLAAVELLNRAIFDNARENEALRSDAMSVCATADLVYIDPPYYSPHSDNEYVRRYHFVEGLACDWRDVEIQWNTKTRKFRNYPTPFATRRGAADAFNMLFNTHRNSILLVSYSSNSLPTRDEMLYLLRRYKHNVDLVSIDHLYSFGTHGHKVGDNKNRVQEYLFVGY
jgi:DNA adenine methylase